MTSTTLLLVDLQNDYFPGGKMELEGAVEAATRAARVLATFRATGLPVVHVRHLSVRPGATFFLPGTEGAEIHPSVAPQGGEPIVEKNYPNSFRATELEARLGERGTKHLVVAGMMTHMCVDSTVRQAFDLGYRVTLLGDACATRTLSAAGESVPAADVHRAFLAALQGLFAEVTSVEDYLAAHAAP